MNVTNHPGVMSEYQKELVATAVAVSIRCDDCVAYHVDKAKKLGAVREELVEILAVAIEMGVGLPLSMRLRYCLISISYQLLKLV